MKNFRYEVQVLAQDKHRLWVSMVEELKFYNHLNANLSDALKKNPKAYKHMAKKLRIFGEVSEHNINVKEMVRTKVYPESIAPFKDQLTFLDDEQMTLIESGVFETTLSPRIKRNMAVQMFKYYIDQAAAYNDDGSLRYGVQFLESQPAFKKRHIQLHRKMMIIKNDGDKTTISVPGFLTNSFVLPNAVKKTNWNLMILHQTPGKIIDQNSKWYVDFRPTADDYLLKYLDYNKIEAGYKSAYNLNRNDYKKSLL